MAIDWKKWLDEDTEPLPPGLSPPVGRRARRPTLGTEPPQSHTLPPWFTTAFAYVLEHLVPALRAFVVSCVREALQGIEAECPKPAAPRRLVGATELGKALGIHPAWLRAEAKAGRLPAVRTGRRFRFDPEEVIEALKRQATEGQGHGHC